MNELSNQVTSTGTYNSVPTSLTSNTSIVNIVDGLTLVKSADKTNWIDGILTYTIEINNDTNTSYENPVVTDILNSTLIDFVDGSVTINGASATELQYTYNDGTLTIKPGEVQANSKTTITFSVKKKVTNHSS